MRSPYKKSPWFYHAPRFEPGKDNVFTDCDDESHNARRKKLAAGVSHFDSGNDAYVVSNYEFILC